MEIGSTGASRVNPEAPADGQGKSGPSSTQTGQPEPPRVLQRYTQAHLLGMQPPDLRHRVASFLSPRDISAMAGTSRQLHGEPLAIELRPESMEQLMAWLQPSNRPALERVRRLDCALLRTALTHETLLRATQLLPALRCLRPGPVWMFNPESIASATRLEELHLAPGASWSLSSRIDALPRTLRVLDMEGNILPISCVQGGQWSHLSALEWLSLSSAQLMAGSVRGFIQDDHLNGLQSLKNLHHLELRQQYGVTNETLAKLTDLPLREVALDSTMTTPEGLAQLPASVCTLSYSNARCLGDFTVMRGLKELSLVSSAITTLEAGPSTLEVLDLWGCTHLVPEEMRHLTSLPRLRELRWEEAATLLPLPDMSALSTLTRLRTDAAPPTHFPPKLENLEFADWDEVEVARLFELSAQLPNLRSLCVCNARAESLAQLDRLQALQQIEFYDTPVRARDLQCLANIPGLRSIVFDSSCGVKPSEIEALKQAMPNVIIEARR